jgi:hypothetical protein
MRAVAISAITFAAFLSLSSLEGRAAPWCASYGGGNNGGGGTNCGFYTFEQCLAAKSGNGGFCDRNPFELGSASSAYGYVTREPRRRSRRHR